MIQKKLRSTKQIMIVQMLAFSAIVNSIFAYDFREGEYEETRNFVMEILQRYPPDEYEYVGLGRSPTPVIAFMKALGISSHNVPLTSFRYGELGNPDLNDSQVAQLSTHFRHYLPSKEKLGAKKLLLLDNAQSGKSLVAGHKYISRFLRDEGIFNPVEKLGFSSPLFKVEDSEYKRQNFRKSELISLTHYPQIDMFFQNTDYDFFAEYPGFDMRKVKDDEVVIPKLDRNKIFDDLVLSYMRKISSDDVLIDSFFPAAGCRSVIEGYGRMQFIFDNLDLVVKNSLRSRAWSLLPPAKPVLPRFEHHLLYNPSYTFVFIQSSKVENGYKSNLGDRVKLVSSVARQYKYDPETVWWVVGLDYSTEKMQHVLKEIKRKYSIGFPTEPSFLIKAVLEEKSLYEDMTLGLRYLSGPRGGAGVP